MMIRNYQQRRKLAPRIVPVPEVATIASFNADGMVQLTFSDGATSTKFYRTTGGGYVVGQRVRILKTSGTITIVEGL